MSSIVPTVGRKVYFYSPTPEGADKPSHALDAKQPFDATILYVWSPTCVNLAVTSHTGRQMYPTSVELRDPSPEDGHNGTYATWMPFQEGQARAAAPTSELMESGPTGTDGSQKPNDATAIPGAKAGNEQMGDAEAMAIIGGEETKAEFEKKHPEVK